MSTDIKNAKIDLNIFSIISEQRIKNLIILQKLGFNKVHSGYRKNKSTQPEDDAEYFRLVLAKKMINIIFYLYPCNGGSYAVSILNHEYSESDVTDYISFYRFHRINHLEPHDLKCLRLMNCFGTLENKVEQSLECINRILEEHFEGILSGTEWPNIPPEFYDYK